MPMQWSSPALRFANVEVTADFFSAHFGIEETFAADWFISLRPSTRGW